MDKPPIPLWIKVLAWSVALIVITPIYLLVAYLVILMAYALLRLGFGIELSVILSGAIMSLAIYWWWPIRNGKWDPPWRKQDAQRSDR